MSNDTEYTRLPSHIPTDEESLIFGMVCTIVVPWLPAGSHCVLHVQENGFCRIYLDRISKPICNFIVRANKKLFYTFESECNFQTGKDLLPTKHVLEYDFQNESKSQNILNLVKAIHQYAPELERAIKGQIRKFSRD